MKETNKGFDLLVQYLRNNSMTTPMKVFIGQQEREEFLKHVSPTEFETLLNFFCFIYKTYNDRLHSLKEYIDSTEGQIDNTIMKSLFESQDHTLSTLHGWIKTLCEKVLKYFNVVEEKDSDKLVSLVVSYGIDQLKRYVGSKKIQDTDTIELLRAQKDIENSQILPDLKMDELLAELMVSFTGLERYFSRIALQDYCMNSFLDEADKHKKQIEANVMVKNNKMTVGRFFQNMLSGR